MEVVSVILSAMLALFLVISIVIAVFVLKIVMKLNRSIKKIESSLDRYSSFLTALSLPLALNDILKAIRKDK